MGSLPHNLIGGYAEFEPPLAQRQYADTNWKLAIPFSRQTCVHHRFVVDPSVNFSLLRRKNKRGEIESASIRLKGPITKSSLASFPPGLEMVSVRLHLDWCLPVLGIHPKEILDTSENFATLNAALAQRWVDEIGSVPDIDEALTFFTAQVHSLAQQKLNCYDPSYRHYITSMVRSGGTSQAIQTLASQLSVTSRHLRRSVNDIIGLSPKRYTRMLRLVDTLRLADQEKRPNWAQLANAMGYSDQAHMIREFKDLIQISPRRIHLERREESRDYETAPSELQ